MLSPTLAARVAAYFFARPQRRKNRDWMQDFLDTSVNESLLVEGTEIKPYLWPGSKRGILFLHGWRSNAARWKYLISKLQLLDVDLIAVDAPGHGESKQIEFTPPNYAELVETLIQKYQPKIIVAHSVGAYTALFHFNKYKPKGIKYVLMAPTYDIMLPINTMFDILRLSKKTQKAYIDIVENDLNKKMNEIKADDFVSPQGPDGILLHDVNDKILPYKDSLKIIEKSKLLKLHKIENNGHRMQNDDVEEVIIDYITSCFR